MKNTKACAAPIHWFAIAAAMVWAAAFFATGTGNAAGNSEPAAPASNERTPQQWYEARFPQPATVGSLIGLPVLDFDDKTLGFVDHVVQRPDGRIEIIVPWRGWLRWAGVLGKVGTRPVAVPLEGVVILARQLDTLYWQADMFEKQPTDDGLGRVLAPTDVVRVALGRR